MIKSILLLLGVVLSIPAHAQELEVAWNNDYSLVGYKDSKGVLVIPYKYKMASTFAEGLAPVKLNGKWGYIDKNDQQRIAFIYEDAEPFSEGLAAVKAGGKWGFINKQGKQIVAPAYDWVNGFKEGMAAVAPVQKAGWGYINKEGRMVIRVQYRIARDFSGGVALVADQKGYLHIDKNGKTQDGERSVNTRAIAATATPAQGVSGKATMPDNNPDAEIEAASEKMKYPASAPAAIKILRKYDAAGHMPKASYYLARGFAAGQVNPPKKEIDSALFYCQKATQQGYRPAMYFLGTLYQHATGDDIPMPTDRNRYAYLIDKKKARYWYNEAAQTGNMWAVQKVTLLDKAEAALELRDAYSNGYTAFDNGNYEEALRWWKLAAFEGHDADAYYGLAVLHHMGKIPGADYNKAIEYYQKSADLGKKEALAEKQKVLDYFAALEAARQRAATAKNATTTQTGESYEEWWEKTYGRGGSQNSRPMPNQNIPQATYRTGSQSESDRHQRAMDQIYRDTEKQMKRGFKYE
ncbi:SEL1-like repeat protein [Taibaiella chishuiensis]|uniref:Sel1 repeat-containing protein n=1 Tax=Taibaiella chishuiensis TaxID=1434707 RepID=A0A2P8D2V4_9BACT|nr:SEL1-like repeat protein [Taibaiella chishuiensis]PSK91562.1 Sel1 repeat-containing protein [Taibaiella chishuiensis]